jgi:hypothetical protein
VDRVFLNANVLFSAAYRANSGLLKLWKLKSVILCSSRYALAEARVNLATDSQRAQLELLAERLHFFDTFTGKLPSGVVLPDKDAPILLSAIQAAATHLLTGDLRHFGAYFGRKIEGIEILLSAAYLKKAL